MAKNGKKNIWIVDDDQSILEVIQIVLEEAGYNVQTIPSEGVFQERIRKQLPDLILLDILLSGADGRDIAKQVKRTDTTKNIPVIMMSADTHIKEKCAEAEANDYIKKPFDIDELEQMVARHLK